MKSVIFKSLVLSCVVLMSTTLGWANDLEVFTLKNGVEVWFDQVLDSSQVAEEEAIVSVSFAFTLPLGVIEYQKPFVAALGPSMMLKGAGAWNENEFQMAAKQHAIEIAFDNYKNFFTGSMRFLMKHRDQVVKLFNATLTQPHFNGEVLEKVKSQMRAGMISGLSSPETYASAVFNNQIYPFPHWAGEIAHLSDLERVTREDLVDWHKETFFTDRLRVVVIGDINKAQASQLLEDLFAGIPKSANLNSIPAHWSGPPSVPSGKTIIVDHDNAQASVAMALDMNFIKSNSRQYFTATLLNYILGGGGFASRLMEEVRVKEGLVYGIFSRFKETAYGNVFTIDANTSPEKVPRLIEIVRRELKRMAEEGPTEEEIQNAKNYLIGIYPLYLSSRTGKSNRLLTDWIDGRGGSDYGTKRTEILQSITREELKEVAKGLLKEENLFVVVAGKDIAIKADQVISSQDLYEEIVGKAP